MQEKRTYFQLTAVKVNTKIYNIIMVDDNYNFKCDKDIFMFGQCDTINLNIYINVDSALDNMISTFSHELVHAIKFEYYSNMNTFDIEFLCDFSASFNKYIYDETKKFRGEIIKWKKKIAIQ